MPLYLAPSPPAPQQVLRMKVRSYIPDFKLAFEHFCIHTGERGAPPLLAVALSHLHSPPAALRGRLHQLDAQPHLPRHSSRTCRTWSSLTQAVGA